MKKFNLKLLVLVLALAIVATFFVACDKAIIEQGVELPDFSINFVDGETTIAVTDEMVSSVALSTFERERSDSTEYYKGFKISDLINEIEGLADVDNIESLLVVAIDGYGSDKPALPVANFENAYFALFTAQSADGEYVFLDEDDGPVRLFDLTSGTEVKAIAQVATVTVNRALELPDFSIDFVDGETTIAVTDEMLAAVELSSFTFTKKDVTTYYQGYKVANILAAVTGLTDVEGIVSLTVIHEALPENEDDSDYSQDLPEANFENAYFALFASATEDGEFVFLDAADGPVRLYDTTTDTTVKSVKQITDITVNRAD